MWKKKPQIKGPSNTLTETCGSYYYEDGTKNPGYTVWYCFCEPFNGFEYTFCKNSKLKHGIGERKLLEFIFFKRLLQAQAEATIA